MEWINVEEQLPKKRGFYLTCRFNGDIDKMEWLPGLMAWRPMLRISEFMPNQYDIKGKHGGITHWMPLPPPPAAGEERE